MKDYSFISSPYVVAGAGHNTSAHNRGWHETYLATVFRAQKYTLSIVQLCDCHVTTKGAD